MNSDIKIGIIVLFSIVSGIGFVLLAAPSPTDKPQNEKTIVSRIFEKDKDSERKSYLDTDFKLDLYTKDEPKYVEPKIVKKVEIAKSEQVDLPNENKVVLQKDSGSLQAVKNNPIEIVENNVPVTDVTPKETPKEQVEKPIVKKELEDFTYTVKEGDNLSKIARAHYNDGSKHELISLANNGIKSENLKIGMKLLLPGAESTKKLSANIKVVEKSTNVENNKPVIYKVKAGDTISTIARKIYGKSYSLDEIKKANNGKDLSRLKIGESLIMPVQNKKNN